MDKQILVLELIVLSRLWAMASARQRASGKHPNSHRVWRHRVYDFGAQVSEFIGLIWHRFHLDPTREAWRRELVRRRLTGYIHAFK